MVNLKINKMAEEIKKSYNPFKMWGSLVGFCLGIIIAVSGFLLNIGTKNIGVSELLKLIVAPFIIPYAIIFGCFNPTGGECEQKIIVMTLGIITFLVISFLLGWAIHSLIRKIKSKNK